MTGLETWPRIRQPQQTRSRVTLERILTAAEELLQSNLMEDITLGHILERSGVSVGAFYARFPNKDALIPCLYDRYDLRLATAARRVLKPSRWTGLDLDRRLRLLFRYVVHAYRINRGLMRALSLKVRLDPEVASPIHRRHRVDLYSAAATVLLGCREEIAHADPEGAVSFGLLLAGSTFREKILFAVSPHAETVGMDDRRLADQTACAVAAYLRTGGAIR